ncbi:MAG: ABC transporter permease [Acidobacteriota bacterium]
MLNTSRSRILPVLLENAPIILFAGLFAAFSLLSSQFLQGQNFVNILTQTSSIAIIAIGMTFVLLTAGIDLSVGSMMFLSAAVLGKMVFQDWPLVLVLPAVLAAGALYGAVNAFFIVRLRIVPFIVTLGTLFIGRGLGLWITETRAMNLPDRFSELASLRTLGIPAPILAFALVTAVAHFILTQTTFGRQIYAVGYDREAAAKAGINVNRILAAVYVISGLCAVMGGMVSLAQLGAVAPTFGSQREFAAIAAAVLGGASLFGGRGRIFPGTVLGATTFQLIENGMVILNADPYLYPLVTGLIIFMAVFIDSLRHTQLSKLRRRKIRTEKTT